MPDGFDRILAMGVATAFEVRGQSIGDAAQAVPEGTIRTLPETGAMGEVVASAVSLGFAIEVYLKTLLSGFGVHPPRSHSLNRLFNLLPDPGKRLAAAIYAEERSRKGSGIGAITLAVGEREVPVWEDSLAAPADIESALGRIADVVVAWRYPFEVSIPGGDKYQFRHLEYGSLLACCQVFGRMCEILVLEASPRAAVGNAPLIDAATRDFLLNRREGMIKRQTRAAETRGPYVRESQGTDT